MGGSSDKEEIESWLPRKIIAILMFLAIPIAAICQIYLEIFWLCFFCGVWGLFIFGYDLIKMEAKAKDKIETYKSRLIRNHTPTRTDLYRAAVQLVIHAENTSRTRMTNFLTANSILMLAWATVFVNFNQNAWTLIVMSLGGFILSFLWAPFRSRSRRYLRRYADVVVALEQDLPRSPAVCGGPMNEGLELRFLKVEKFSRSKNLAVIVPPVFTGAFYFALLKSIWFLFPQRETEKGTAGACSEMSDVECSEN